MASRATEVIDAAGGTITIDRLTLQFPAETFPEPTAVTCSILDGLPSGPGYLSMAYAFELEAAPFVPPVQGKAKRPADAPPPEVAAPLRRAITMVIRYDGLFPTGSDLSLVSLVALNRRSQRWQHPRSQRDDRGQTIGAETVTLGRFAVAINGRLRQPAPAIGTIGPKGGNLEYAGRLTVELPPGAVDQDVQVQINLPKQPAPAWMGFPFTFSIIAKRVSTGQPVTNFRTPISLWLTYEDAELGVDPPVKLRFHHFDERSYQWIPIATKMELGGRNGKRVMARVDHLTDFGVIGSPGADAGRDVLPSMKFASSDLFTGASTITYPIKLPPGTAGLTPQLFLTYNGEASHHSQRANYLATDFAGHGIQSASTVGQGFELDPGSVTWYRRPDDSDGYYLSLNGETHELLQGNDGNWHTAVESFLRIRTNVSVPVYGGSRTVAWQVTAKDGTQYLFGFDAAERDRRIHVGWPDGQNPQQYANKWMLGQIRDTHGNTIDYQYERLIRNVWRAGEGGCNYNPAAYTPAVFLEKITYGGRRIDSAAAPQITVKFIRSNLNGWHTGHTNWVLWDGQAYGVDRMDVNEQAWILDPCNQYCFDVKALDRIEVYVGGESTPVRKYQFQYDDPPGDQKIGGIPLRLSTVTEYGSNWSSTLPSIQFNDGMFDDTDTGDLGYSTTHTYWLMTSVQNGLGGQVSFVNQFSGSETDANGIPTYVDKWGPNGQYMWVRIARIERKTVSPGVGPAMTTRYVYQGPRGSGDPSRPEFRGHERVTAYRLTSGGTDYSYDEHHFCQGLDATRQVWLGGSLKRQFQDYKELRGREFLTKSKAISGTVLSVRDQEWVRGDLLFNASYFTRLTDVWEYVYAANQTDENTASKIEKRVVYDYYTNYPDNLLYGNVRQVQYHGATDDLVDGRTLYREHVLNPTDYIVDRVHWEAYYEGVGTGGQRLTGVGFYYDRDGSGNVRAYGSAPTKGDLVMTDRLYSYGGGSWNGHAQTQYWYDTWGNRVKEQDPNGQLTQSFDQNWSLAYDTTYRAYPYRQRNAKSQDTVTEYDGRWGKLKKVTDPNGLVIETTFDVFGRESTVTRAGELWTTTNYHIWPGDPRFQVDTGRWIDASTALWTRHFYDGAGRLIQRHLVLVPVDGVTKDVLVDYAYDEFGRKISESVPYAVQAYTGGGAYSPYQTPNPSVPKTTWEYDALDRVTRVVQPNGTAVSTIYDVGTYGSVKKEYRYVTEERADGRNHRKGYAYDAFGRLLDAIEYSGEANPYTVYAQTYYQYDRLGHLTQITDQAGNVWKMRYDERGLKVKLHDPDLCGNTSDEYNVAYWWSYAYDPAGNLTSQTDPKGQTISFLYDELNRLANKFYAKTYAYPLTNPLPSGVARLISAADIDELRAAVNLNLRKRGRSPISWTDAVLTTGSTRVRAVHFNELFDGDAANHGGVTNGIARLWQDATKPWPPSGSTGWPVTPGTSQIRVADNANLKDWLKQYEESPGGYKIRAIYRFDETANGIGRRTSLYDGSGETTYTYDLKGRLTQEVRTLFGSTYTTSYSYDRQDRVVTMTLPDGEVVSYVYDPHHLARVSTSRGYNYIENITYNAFERPIKGEVHRGGALRMVYKWGYYGLGGPYDTGGPTASYGRRWRLLSQTGGGATIQDLQYEYDGVGNVTRYNQPTFGDDFSYTYDHLDRLLQEKVTSTGQVLDSFAYNTIGNLTSRNGVSNNYPGVAPHPHAVTGVSGQWTQEYDANGNATQYTPSTGSPTLYDYDAENRLLTVSQGSNRENVVARFLYDGDGKRTRRVDTAGIVTYASPAYEYDHKTGVVTKHIYAGPGGRLLAVVRGGTDSYVHLDHLGSVVKTTDVYGTQVSLSRYQSYGDRRGTDTGTAPTDARYTGQRLDVSTGLYFYQARYYQPGQGRFTQPDTIVPDYQNPQSLNRYSYTFNSPLRYTDPTGHDPNDQSLTVTPVAVPMPVPTSTPVPAATPGPVYAPVPPVPAPVPAPSISAMSDPTPGESQFPIQFGVITYRGPSDNELANTLAGTAVALDMTAATVSAGLLVPAGVALLIPGGQGAAVVLAGSAGVVNAVLGFASTGLQVTSDALAGRTGPYFTDNSAGVRISSDTLVSLAFFVPTLRAARSVIGGFTAPAKVTGRGLGQDLGLTSSQASYDLVRDVDVISGYSVYLEVSW